MVRLVGPLFSREASGPLAGILDFVRTAQGTNARVIRPANDPASAPQISSRAMLAGLQRDWKNLTAADHAAWEPLAAAAHIAPYHAYLAFNLRRWREYRAPQQQPGPEQASTAGGLLQGVTGFPSAVRFRYRPLATLGNGWGLTLHHEPGAACTASHDNLITTITWHTLVITNWYHHALAPGLHSYRTRRFTTSGLYAAQSTLMQATVT